MTRILRTNRRRSGVEAARRPLACSSPTATPADQIADLVADGLTDRPIAVLPALVDDA